jgi:HYDIN/CFA65/VesB family protein
MCPFGTLQVPRHDCTIVLRPAHGLRYKTSPMKCVGTCWSKSIIAVLLALATMQGCQGVRSVWSTPQSAARLTAAPVRVSFGNVQIGTTQTQSDTLTSFGDVSPLVTLASVKGAGFSSDGLSVPLPPSPGQGTTLTVQNTGALNAIISQVTIAGKGFNISGISTPRALGPGQSVRLSVTFTPQSAGNYSGSIAVSSNASNPTLVIPLIGSATGQGGKLSVSFTSINVGNVVVGISGTQTGTLRAIGASVAISSVSVGGTNPSEFSITGLALPVRIAAGQSVNFTVKFAPRARGVASANALFTSNALNSPTAATLTGTGIPAPVHTVSLSWTASPSTNITGYNVYRAIFNSVCGSYSKINSGLNETTTYTDSSVAGGRTYCYVTTAVDSTDIESGFSNTAEAVIPSP